MFENLSFDKAFILLKNGFKIKRKEWKKGECLVYKDGEMWKYEDSIYFHRTISLTYDNMFAQDWECGE